MQFTKSLGGLLAILAGVFLFLYFPEGDSGYERTQTPWERPLYEDGRWILAGIVEHGVETREFSWGQADLVMARYGKGALWVVAGVTDADGNFESRVVGVESHESLMEAFRQPRRVTFSVLGTEKGTHLSSCEGLVESMCLIISTIEKGNPELMTGYGEQELTSQSIVFIQTGEFPSHYRFGILTWQIDLGEIIEQGLEGF